MTCNNDNCGCKSSADNKTPIQLNSSGTANINNMIIGPRNDDYGRISTYIYDPYHPATVVDVKVTSETIEITYIKRAMYSVTTYNNISIGSSYDVSNPDIVYKEIYGIKDGKLGLLNTVYGKIIPPKLEETYEFPE